MRGNLCLQFVLLLLTSSESGRGEALSDPNDWINVQYIVSQGRQPNTLTGSARQSILGGATSTSSGGPWTITKNNGILPPSRDSHDYLSWAPYHWPDCNWCQPKGATQIWVPSNNSQFDPTEPDYYDDGGDWGDYSNLGSGNISESHAAASSPPSARDRMVRIRREKFSVDNILDASTPRRSQVQAIHAPSAGALWIPTTTSAPIPSTVSPSTTRSTSLPGSQATTSDHAFLSDDDAQETIKATRKCTPSPTTGLAPSATWTTCPYVTRDGQVNPDVRTLTGSSSVTHMTQAVLYNAFAHALAGAQSASYQQEAASVLDTFFISPSTAMRPHMNFGQIVRGPGKKGQQGTFTGVLDMRGLVRVINAVMVLRATGGTAWTAQREAGFKAWVTSYVSWLEQSPIAIKAAGSPNNHGTFFVNQLAAAKILLGDKQGAIAALQGYFGHQFLDQIASSGEQPFEAVRTRPFHYRAFNLEAMITNAKLGDELGVDFWTAKSKYGASIQTAVNYLMTVDPRGEDPLDAVPHVAAVAAAYGDPSGKYMAYLQRVQSTYRSRPYWFYDQPAALPSSPAGRRLHVAAEEASGTAFDGVLDFPATAVNNSTTTGEPDSAGVSADDEGRSIPIPFECPAVFEGEEAVEIDDDLFVTCEELRPLYELLYP
ncbi:chondroitin AC/alginate lyase [Artomyces pyxidatus]|uniref:Chondroitin AC/alginate lyase n=1 Tax=Artomyces pyxidatus TaxID=48021 RepID=A0ACB8TIM0_9AGAM|nr:chondroitin AC/alginate lyase [Artomyces pyxidatus]